MATQFVKLFVYGLVFFLGLACCGFAIQQRRYMRLIASGNQAVSEKRFAREDILLVNQGVLAYKARNLPRAADFFRRVSQAAPKSPIEGKALYNLGRILLELKEAERAAEFFKAALRLDPDDREAKYNLERLYHFVLMKQGARSEAALKQAPGSRQEKGDQPSGGGHGRGKSKPDI
jgi:Ca-activated chloride channel family protein